MCAILPAAEKGQADSDDEHNSPGKGKQSDMTWLTRSDLVNGQPPPVNPLVDEAIRDANRDVPEVTQVRMLGWPPLVLPTIHRCGQQGGCARGHLGERREVLEILFTVVADSGESLGPLFTVVAEDTCSWSKDLDLSRQLVVSDRLNGTSHGNWHPQEKTVALVRVS